MVVVWKGIHLLMSAFLLDIREVFQNKKFVYWLPYKNSGLKTFFMLNTSLDNLLFIDIETVSQYETFDELDDTWKALWAEKIERLLPEGDNIESFYTARAAIMAEFGKIICISVGYFRNEAGVLHLRVKSYYADTERELLLNVLQSLNQWQSSKKQVAFCGHNIREFDIPYLCRRLLVNNISIPCYLDFQSMKPWETNLVDTFQLWKFGDFKNYTSLKLLAACMNVPSPKNDIDGSQVGEVYWKENNIARIAAYCARDVITVGQLILRFRQMPLLTDEQISVM